MARGGREAASRNQKSPRQGRGFRRVASLLDAAAAVIVEKGYEAATMKEIARRAGAAIGSLYQFFGTKDALAVALAERYREAIIAAFDALAEAEKPLGAEPLAAALVEGTSLTAQAHPSFPALMVARNRLSLISARDRADYAEALRSVLRRHLPPLADEEFAPLVAIVRQILRWVVDLELTHDDESGWAKEELTLLLSIYLRDKIGQLAGRDPAHKRKERF